MAEYIEREVAVEKITFLCELREIVCDHDDEFLRGLKNALNAIKSNEYIPSADVQPADRWISVEDRLPNDDGWYLVYKFKQVRVAEWCESCWYNERDLPIDDVAISHWQPLPESPKED